jgi:hypothetical protein
MKQLEDLKKFMVEQMKPLASTAAPVAPSPVPAPVPEPVAPSPVPAPLAPSPVPVPVSASEPAERLPKIVYPENSRSHASPITVNSEQVVEIPATLVTEAPVVETKVAETVVTEAPKVTEETQEPPKATIEVNAHELEEIRALLAERQKNII